MTPDICACASLMFGSASLRKTSGLMIDPPEQFAPRDQRDASRLGGGHSLLCWPAVWIRSKDRVARAVLRKATPHSIRCQVVVVQRKDPQIAMTMSTNPIHPAVVPRNIRDARMLLQPTEDESNFLG